MNKTIIFINGWSVPKFIAKSKWIWDEELWSDYQCIWISSKTPTSDGMVKRELDKLQSLLRKFPDATLAGHSLGGWWSSNLALRADVRIRRLVLWTPLGNTSDYPIFNVTPRYSPVNQPVTNTYGPHRVLVYSAKDDLIVPPHAHGRRLSQHFSATDYPLKGGHFFQPNHREALEYMKDWIEL